MWNNAITLDDLMDEDSTGGGEAVSINDVFYDNNSSPMMQGSPEPAPSSPESSVDIKPVIRPSIIVPVKSKKIFLKNNLHKHITLFFSEENVKVEPCQQPGGSNEFLYVESKRARLDREKVGSF